MRIPVLITVLTIAFQAQASFACSPVHSVGPRSLPGAIATADTVLHFKVLSHVNGPAAGAITLKVEVLEVLKGTFHRSEIQTASSSQCGWGPLTAGEEYLTFFGVRGPWGGALGARGPRAHVDEVKATITAMRQ